MATRANRGKSSNPAIAWKRSYNALLAISLIWRRQSICHPSANRLRDTRRACAERLRGKDRIACIPKAMYVAVLTSKTNYNYQSRITYECENKNTAGGRTGQNTVYESHFQFSFSHTGY